MSDLLTHWAVFDDCRRLAAGHAEIDPIFRDIIEREREYARIGAITRGGNHFMPSLLRSLRRRWDDDPSERDKRDTRRKIGFILGCLTHQACDNAMKPLISQVAQFDWSRAHTDIWAGRPGAHERFKRHNEISAYYDTHVFKKVYLSGQDEPFSPQFLADLESGGTKYLEEFVRTLFQRALLASHTLSPNLGDPEDWLDHIFAKYQELYVDVNVYVRAFHEPEAGKLQEFKVESDFYVDDDPVIRVCRQLQAGQSVPEDQLYESLRRADNRSAYAHALILGIDYLKAGSAYWQGEADELDTPNWEDPNLEPVEH